MGGLDWSGLPIIAAHVGVTDIEGLLDRLEAILLYKSPESKDPADRTE
jgi:hypothetical protein